MATPRFAKPGKGKAWPPAVKALVIVTAEEADGNLATLKELLAKRARWPGGLPADRTLRLWAGAVGLDLSTGNPDNSARTAKARQARFARLERHREDLSELIGSRILPKSAELIVRRLEEQDEVEAYVAAARERLTEAVAMQAAADGMGDEAVRSARRQVVLARLMLEVERDGRVPFRDLIRLTQVGVAQHLTLEGLGDDEEDETNPIIVEISLPRPAAIEATAAPVPQNEFPERT
jgi:hypothetical protein